MACLTVARVVYGRRDYVDLRAVTVTGGHAR